MNEVLNHVTTQIGGKGCDLQPDYSIAIWDNNTFEGGNSQQKESLITAGFFYSHYQFSNNRLVDFQMRSPFDAILFFVGGEACTYE